MPPARSVGVPIAQDPSAFVSRYGYQIATRPQILTAPWIALRDELGKRYLTNMGLGGHSPGSDGPQYLKSLIFVAYAVGITGLLAISRSPPQECKPCSAHINRHLLSVLYVPGRYQGGLLFHLF